MSNSTISQLVSQLTQLGALEVPQVESTLGTTLAKTNENPNWSFHKGALNAPFAQAEFRVGKPNTQALLSLWPPEDTNLTEAELDLDAWGTVQDIDSNHRIPPEGVDIYSYLVNKVNVSIQFTHNSRRLRCVTLEWKS